MRFGRSVALLVLCCHGAAAQPSQLSPLATEQLRAIELEQQQRTPTEEKLSSRLLYAVRAAEGRPAVAAVPHLRPLVAENAPEPRQLVNIKGQITPELEAFIAAQGGTEIAALPRFGVLSARIPLRQVPAIAARPDVRSLDFSPKPVNNQTAGLTNPEGDAAHRGQDLREYFATSGEGVKVCVVSDSVDHLEESQARGALGPVEVLTNAEGSAWGEGTAMLEIVHRIAPGATLAFATSGPTDVAMALNIARLAVAKCDIIVDDVTYDNEPPFQDGIIAQIAREVSDTGILFFSSAANSGNQLHGQSGTWEGDFRPSATTLTVGGKTYRFNEFAPGVTLDTVTAYTETHAQAVLTWNDPQGAASNEYQLAVIGADGQVLDHSTNVITGHQDPVQTVTIEPGSHLAILKAEGAEPRFLRIITNRGRLAIGTTGATFGHNALGADNAFSVAAVSAAGRTGRGASFRSGIPIDDYSSDGPRRMFYTADGTELTPGNLTSTGGILLMKPDFAAADCVTTSVAPRFAPFCGTSAAAPQAAGIAALYRSGTPSLTPKEIRAALTYMAFQSENSQGWNVVAGFGILNTSNGAAMAFDLTGVSVINFDRDYEMKSDSGGSIDTSRGVFFTRFPPDQQVRGWRIEGSERATMSVVFTNVRGWQGANAGRPLELTIVHRAAPEGGKPGHGPISISINDKPLITNYDVTAAHPGADGWVRDRFLVPPGGNRSPSVYALIEKTGGPGSYWIRSIRLAPVGH